MRISWKWLSEMVDLSAAGTPERLAEVLTLRGLEVEAIERQDAGFDKVITARILERKSHPQADRLSLCKVVGSGEPLDVVCGAQNMKAGDIVALAQVGALLPNGLKIAESKIRGEVSHGMLCSEEELKLRDSAEGILILPQSTPIGRPLAEVLGRDDAILVFKLTANRGDCLSHLGMAREIAATLGCGLKPVAVKSLEFGQGACPISIQLEAGEAAPQFLGCYIEGVRIGPSPEWLVRRLEAVGSRSINNVVDATNLVMLECGHPMHAYDADLVRGGKISVRVARAGEEIPLLDGGTVSLQGWELVISDGERAVGLAGVMGGGNSEVRDETAKIFLECAEFDPVLVRRASSVHQRKTDAAHRFERGIDPAGLPHAISRLAGMIVSLAGGKIVGARAASLESRKSVAFQRPEIAASVSYFEKFLGMKVDSAAAERIFVSLGCSVKKIGEQWRVVPPTWRHDLVMREDLAEEIARSLGYDEIAETIPALSSAPTSIYAAASAARMGLVEQTKDVLAGLGFCESLNFAFTSRARLAEFGMKSDVLVMNPLSEEHEALVPSLVPGIVHNALGNWRRHFGSESLGIRLFELRPTYHLRAGSDGVRALGEMETPVEERWRLVLGLSGPRYAAGLRNDVGDVDFFDLKAVIESLFEKLGTRGIRFQPMTASRSPNPFVHPGQSVEVLAGKDVAGFFGLLHPKMSRELKCRSALWVAELDWEAIAKLSRPIYEGQAFKPMSEFPPIERDFALVVKSDLSADRITQLALKAGRPLAKVARIFDVYRGSQVAEGMTSVAVRVIFYDESRSLQESEAEAASAQILEAWKKELGAELRT